MDEKEQFLWQVSWCWLLCCHFGAAMGSVATPGAGCASQSPEDHRTDRKTYPFSSRQTWQFDTSVQDIEMYATAFINAQTA